jgi:predicted AAA+ superfamily ATPase
MNKSESNLFQISNALASTINKMTAREGNKYQLRNFVKPLLEFCTDNCYDGKVGIVYGIRSTGKTVGMLQTAEILTSRGFKVAYAQFASETVGMDAVTEEIRYLSTNGISHFFVDEASNLGGFVNCVSDWSDRLVPELGIKIILAGTDSFMLWTAERSSLFHRYKQFSTNWTDFSEYKRITGLSFETYKKSGGIYTNDNMLDFVQTAVVENLVHTIQHLTEDENRRTYYTDALCGIGIDVMYKAIISILKCAVEEYIETHFVDNSEKKNIVDLGTVISGLSGRQKRDIKQRVADSVDIYRNFIPVQNPLHVIDTLILFLVNIGCLIESTTATSDFGSVQKTYSFSHNALMNFAIEETIKATLDLPDIDHGKYRDSIRQASIGAVTENILFVHVFLAASPDEKVFKYRDKEDREVDIVSINRDKKILRLFEVKATTNINFNYVFIEEAKHLYNQDVLQYIGEIDTEYEITRVIAYMGKTQTIGNCNGELHLINIEELLVHCMDIESYLNRLDAEYKQSIETVQAKQERNLQNAIDLTKIQIDNDRNTDTKNQIGTHFVLKKGHDDFER